MVSRSRSFSTSSTGIASLLRSLGSVLREEAVHGCDSGAPEDLVPIEQVAGQPQPFGFRVHALLPPAPPLADETGLLEHADVLLHGGQAHPVGAGECGDGLLTFDHPGEDVAPGGVRERLEDPVDLLLAQFVCYNHLVAG